jgi:hypothetical protein
MLTINGYYKLVNESIPNTDWKIDFCSEKPDYYEIALVNIATYEKRYIHLSRKAIRFVGHSSYFFSEDGRELASCVTIMYLKNMDNLLNSIGNIVKR